MPSGVMGLTRFRMDTQTGGWTTRKHYVFGPLKWVEALKCTLKRSILAFLGLLVLVKTHTLQETSHIWPVLISLIMSL